MLMGLIGPKHRRLSAGNETGIDRGTGEQQADGTSKHHRALERRQLTQGRRFNKYSSLLSAQRKARQDRTAAAEQTASRVGSLCTVLAVACVTR